MTTVSVKYNPYRLETQILINGENVDPDSYLKRAIQGRRLQEWAGDLPELLRNNLKEPFSAEFHGMSLDWDDFEDAFRRAVWNGVIENTDVRFVEAKNDDDVREKIMQVFEDLREGPVLEFQNPKLLKAVEDIYRAEFPVNVIATMSSGKSTLINALLWAKLMPSKQGACTATITEILDDQSGNMAETFSAVAYDSNLTVLETLPALTYADMERLNNAENVYQISVKGNIPFLNSQGMALKLVDTPGPNNAQNQGHKNMTYRAINSDSNNLILYVLNGTQLGINDDASLLDYVSEQIRTGGKQMRDRFLFVINKMDAYNPQMENISQVIQGVKAYLAEHGIDDPQIFPCSAFTALNLRTDLKGVNLDNMTRAQKKSLSVAAKDTLPMVDKFIDFPAMHMEQYTTLSPTAERQLETRLREAEEKDDTVEQALIHCGIRSIEAAITAYVTKYARTKKVKDLVESFQEVLESSQVLAKAKTQVATDAQMAEACRNRAAAMKAKIENGEEAVAFKSRINKLNPLPTIQKKMEQLETEINEKMTKVFRLYGSVIHSREEAKRLVMQFSVVSSDAMAELTANLQSVITAEIINVGNQILREYKKKLAQFDESVSTSRLDFQTVDLVRGTLGAMKDMAQTWTVDSFAAEVADDYGTIEYETRNYYEKVGTKPEKVITGSHQKKTGTQKVKSGQHREWAGTRQKKNPNKRWWKIFTPAYITEDVYEMVDDYKDEDVYETVLDYKMVEREVYEERVERIEKYSVETRKIQMALIAKMRMALDSGMTDVLNHAKTQVEQMKAQFTRMFDLLDQEIKEKYAELEKCANDQSVNEARLEENRKILDWIVGNIAEIHEILDIFAPSEGARTTEAPE